jgi:hypothetical protein
MKHMESDDELPVLVDTAGDWSVVAVDVAFHTVADEDSHRVLEPVVHPYWSLSGIEVALGGIVGS